MGGGTGVKPGLRHTNLEIQRNGTRLNGSVDWGGGGLNRVYDIPILKSKGMEHADVEVYNKSLLSGLKTNIFIFWMS